MTLTERTEKAGGTKESILAHIDNFFAQITQAARDANPAGFAPLADARKALGQINSDEWWALYGGDADESKARELVNSVGTQIKNGTWQAPRSMGQIG